jgi:hypothetical protein
MLSSRFNSDSCCPLSVMASILTKVMSSGASRPQLRLPEELLAPAESKGPGSPYLLMKKNVWRAVIEVGFIIFLFYSNLLMGEFERSGIGQKRGVAWAIGDVLPLPILKLPRWPRSSAISFLNFSERDSRQTRL